MKKYIVLSVNDNQDYLFFTPLVCWAWRKFGWEPIVLFHGDCNHEMSQVLSTGGHLMGLYSIGNIDGYRSDTQIQTARLYGAAFNLDNLNYSDDYLMTGDIDMLPLSDYWKSKSFDPLPTVYGHDLTGFGHYPICYIGMSRGEWRNVMGITSLISEDSPALIAEMKRDLDTLPQAKDPDFYKYWFSDQDLITARLNEYGKEKITFINRGQGSHGYARGRVDRGSGGWVLNQPELIDAHLEQQTHHRIEKIERLYALLKHVWPNEDFQWFRDYTNRFRELTGHKG